MYLMASRNARFSWQREWEVITFLKYCSSTHISSKGVLNEIHSEICLQSLKSFLCEEAALEQNGLPLSLALILGQQTNCIGYKTGTCAGIQGIRSQGSHLCLGILAQVERGGS